MVEKFLTNHTDVIYFSSQKENASEQYQKEFELQFMPPFHQHWIYRDQKYYYYKYDNNSIPYGFFNELIGEELSQYFYLPTVHYKIAYDQDEQRYAILSENFSKHDKEYVNIFQFPDLYYLDTYRVFEEMSHFTNNRIQQLQFLKNLKSMIVLDFYMVQEDRNEENFYFEKTGNNYQLANLFDYEISFETLKYYGNSFFLCDFDNQALCYELYQDEWFRSLFQKAYDIDMKQLLHKIEDKYQLKIPRSVRKRYLSYHSEKQNMMQKMNLVMKKR